MLMHLAFALAALVGNGVVALQTYNTTKYLNYHARYTRENGYLHIPIPGAVDGTATITRPADSVEGEGMADPNDPRMACHNDGAPYPTGQLSLTIRAGDPISVLHWQGYTLGGKGSLTVYMARCPGRCVDANSKGLEWFKIDEAGLLSGSQRSGVWALGESQRTSFIPKTLPEGEYLLRHEYLQLATPHKPQWFVRCGQLAVKNASGSGTLPSAEYLVRFPGAYDPNDPSFQVDLDTQEADNEFSYKIAGPAVWKGV